MVEAYVMIMTQTGMSRSLLPRVRDIEGTRRANVVAGEFDIIAHIEAESNEALLALVTEEIQTLDGVGRTRTCIILE